MRFDIIAMNPPYNLDQHKHLLYRDFIYKAVKLQIKVISINPNLTNGLPQYLLWVHSYLRQLTVIAYYRDIFDISLAKYLQIYYFDRQYKNEGMHYKIVSYTGVWENDLSYKVDGLWCLNKLLDISIADTKVEYLEQYKRYQIVVNMWLGVDRNSIYYRQLPCIHIIEKQDIEKYLQSVTNSRVIYTSDDRDSINRFSRYIYIVSQ